MIKRRLLFFSALLALGLFLSLGTAQAGPLTGALSEADFWQLVAESKFAAAARDEAQPGQLEALAARWDAIERVETQPGLSLRLDGSGWAALFRAQPPQLARLAGLLSSLERERGLFNPIELPPDSLDTLDKILARPEYQWRSPAPDWLEALWNRLAEWLSGLFGGSSQPQDNPKIDGVDLFTGLTLVLVAIILGYALYSLFSDVVHEAALEGSAEHEQLLSARTALDRADTLSKSGDYRTAVRYLYLSALLILDERGLLYYDRTKTNREYLGSLAGNAKIAGLLREVISVFDRVWYGFQPVDEASYQRYAAQVRELENQQ